MEPDTPGTDEIIRLESIWSGYTPPSIPIVLSDAEGASLWDVEGRQALDFWCGDAGLILGHRHPSLIRAMEQQSQHITLTPLQCFHTRQGQFCRRLALVTGFDLVKTFASTSQTFEEALHVARLWGAIERGIPIPEAEILFSDANDLETIAHDITPRTVAIVIHLLAPTRPLVPPPEDFFLHLEEIRNKNHLLVIADESATSLGRSGSWLLCHRYDFKPDIVCMGEELGGGIIPQSALLLRRHVVDRIARHHPESPHARSPLAAVIGLAVLDTIELESLALRAEERGKEFRAELQDLVGNCLVNVDGIGSINSIVLLPDVDVTDFCSRLAAQGVLAQPVLPDSVRFSPPLTLTRQELEMAIAAIRRAVGAPR
jgi:ornithine--oxo-acid transaminase